MPSNMEANAPHAGMTIAELAQFMARGPSGRIEIAFLTWWYPWARAQLQAGAVAVPCDGCGAQCCRRTDVYLVEGIDAAAGYETLTRDNGLRYLAKRADGACVYLTDDDRCAVHDDRPPMMCRAFDCRAYPAAGIVIVEPGTDGEITLACTAGLTRFAIVAHSPAERAGMAAAHAEAMRLSADMEGSVALTLALLTWPRLTGGPAAAYVRALERASPLRSALLKER